MTGAVASESVTEAPKGSLSAAGNRAQSVKAEGSLTANIDGEVWHLDVGSSHPGAEVGPKGWAVRPLKWYASWVQNVVRQFGPYPSRAQEI